MKKKKQPKRTSMRRVSVTGEPAPSWTPDLELTELANRCYIACLSPYAKPDLIRVFRNSPEWCLGRCFVEQRIITISRNLCDPLHTLAHEIAHLRFISHGPKHTELTERLYEWILDNAAAGV